MSNAFVYNPKEPFDEEKFMKMVDRLNEMPMKVPRRQFILRGDIIKCLFPSMDGVDKLDNDMVYFLYD